MAGRLLQRATGSSDFDRASFVGRHLTNSAGLGRLARSLPLTELPTASSVMTFWRKLGMDPAELRLEECPQAVAVPYHAALGWTYDRRLVPHRHEDDDGDGAIAEPGKSRRKSAPAFNAGETREIMGRPASLRFFTESSAPGRRRLRLLGIAMSIPANPLTLQARHRPGRLQDSRAGHEPAWAADHLPPRIAHSRRRHQLSRRQHRHPRLTCSATYGLALDSGPRRCRRDGSAKDQQAQMIAAYKLECMEGPDDIDGSGSIAFR